jgi:hypothetical protein
VLATGEASIGVLSREQCGSVVVSLQKSDGDWRQGRVEVVLGGDLSGAHVSVSDNFQVRNAVLGRLRKYRGDLVRSNGVERERGAIQGYGAAAELVRQRRGGRCSGNA